MVGYCLLSEVYGSDFNTSEKKLPEYKPDDRIYITQNIIGDGNDSDLLKSNNVTNLNSYNKYAYDNYGNNNLDECYNYPVYDVNYSEENQMEAEHFNPTNHHVHKMTCEEYLAHYDSCSICRSKLKNRLGVDDIITTDISDIVIYVLGGLLIIILLDAFLRLGKKMK